ncbi:hypothetical protein ABC426_16495 [Lactiplantibacillus plantarum]|uniref:hypothetical protein n=1 Tax=Lactiplantibacillus plantarum TaxID=1590 RepID=UPI000ACD9684|nr:hypothetical protein [Lactiplantibacillus plantarum]MBS0952390.1 hypothetical protein [Lactiplantibacillus plantarum]
MKNKSKNKIGYLISAAAWIASVLILPHVGSNPNGWVIAFIVIMAFGLGMEI